MAGFLSKIFGGKSKDSSVQALVKTTLDDLIKVGGFELDFEVKSSVDDTGAESLAIEISGPDEDLMKDREGQLIDAFQLFLQRVVQHNFAEDKTRISLDCGGYREESNQALIDLADKLKEQALQKGKSVYFRALPPKERKIIHQHLASDERVRSRSVGEGLFKKIKIYPAKVDKGGEDHAAVDDGS
jgi:spoIIIJ-associated protein